MSAINVKPNCGPTACAVILNRSVDFVMDQFSQMFKKTDRWQGRSNWRQLLGFLKKNKIQTKEAPIGGSLAKWVEMNTSATGVYLVRVGNHFLVIKERQVYDNLGSGVSVTVSWCKAKRVTHAVEIN